MLLIAIVLEGLSFRTAIIETNKIRGQASFATFVRRAKQPELPVILLEDLAALTGLAFALVGVVLSLVTGNQYFDVAGTALIGLLLVVVAVVLAIETKSLLLGESASLEAQQRIAAALGGTDGVESIIHMKTLHLGPEELLVAAKIARPAGGVGRGRRRRDRRGRAQRARRGGHRAGHLPRAGPAPRRLPARRAPRAARPRRTLSCRTPRSLPRPGPARASRILAPGAAPL